MRPAAGLERLRHARGGAAAIAYTGGMTPAASLSTARNHLWPPRLALGGCIRGILARDTRGAALTPAQRFNHFPATPMATLTWWLAGTSERLPPDAKADLAMPRNPPLARILFGGPQGRPTVTWNPGDVHTLTLVLAPDAVRLLAGIDPGAWVNRWAPAADVLPPDWLRMCDAVVAAVDDDARVRLAQDFLEPLWHAARPSPAFGLPRYRDWAQALALRAGLSASGRSVRQIERRIKEWTGQPLRELRGVGRSEQAFFEAILAQGDSGPRWADVAASAGYSDQSHLCRETRRVTGFAPEELRQRIRQDETFWAYRIWR
jgi:AraC-like DNA-binding protein